MSVEAEDKIFIVIKNKRAKVIGLPIIVCGNADYTVEFDFDEEWDEVTEKTARFVFNQKGGTNFKDVDFTGNTVAVPVLENIKSVAIGVYSGKRLSSTAVEIPCELSIRCGISS